MPAQRQKSELFAKYGTKLDSAVRKHATDETDYGFQRLPPGINGGIAQLTVCGFKKYEANSNMKRADGQSAAGEFFFRAAGVVVEPQEVLHEGRAVRVVGLQTSIMEPCCDTRKSDGTVVTQEEHIANILNELRKLGADTRAATGADMEVLAELLQETAPYFKFSTSAGTPTPQYPNPRTWENWHGVRGLEGYTPPDATAGAVEDHSAPANGRTSRTSQPTLPFNEFEGDNGQANAPDQDDLDELLARADVDEDASRRLLDIAEGLGIRDQVEAAPSWTKGVELIREAQGVEGPGEEEEAGEGEPEEVEEEAAAEAELASQEHPEEPAPTPPPTPRKPALKNVPATEVVRSVLAPIAKAWKPAKGEVYKFRPIDPKTKKPRTKAVPCRIEAVNLKTQTADLLNYEDRKTRYQSVPWSALSDEG